MATHPRNRNPLANGPYRLGSWEAGRTLTLVRNTQYFGEKPAPEQVIFRVVPENAPAFAALETGDLDEMKLTYAQKKELDAKAGTAGAPRVVTFDELAYSYFGWNNRLPVFADRRVRRALTMLVDRESINRNLFGGLAKLANGPLPPAHWAWDASLAPWPYDPVAAEALLDEAGFRKGAGRNAAQGKRCASRSRSRSAWAATSSARSWSWHSSPSERQASRWRSSRWSGRLSGRRWTRGSAKPGRPR